MSTVRNLIYLSNIIATHFADKVNYFSLGKIEI